MVTTCGPDLEPCTYITVAGADTHVYPGWVPLFAQPPLVALALMPSDEEDLGLGLVLLGPDGGELYLSRNVEPLYPAHTPPDLSAMYAAEAAEDSSLLAPLGTTPQLIALNPATGAEQWRIELAPPYAVADVMLWAELDEWLLLSLQYDYEVYEYLAVHRADGSINGRWVLSGLPAGATVYPGPVWEPAEPERAGTRASVIVYNNAAGAWQRWSFDCAQSTLEQENTDAPGILREENPTPVGGAGAPGPGNAPFQQRLLPGATGGTWETAALVDGMGHVLVVDSAGARWAEAREVP